MKLSVVLIVLSIVCFESVKVKENKKVKELKIPKWKTTKQKYDPWRVDWKAVISGCRAACKFDKRLCNFYIRTAAHDSLSVNKRRGGADGSMLLTEDELSRPENKYDAFGEIVSKNALVLAKRFDASVADIIAVCGAVSSEYLGGPKIIEYDREDPFMVGRYDDKIPNPAGTLPAHNINVTQFTEFTRSRGFTIEEMTALMGSHVLLDNKGCLKDNDRDICDPLKEKCHNLSMFKWKNTYYTDLCKSKIKFTTEKVLLTKSQKIRMNMCTFTSKEFRTESMKDLARELKISPVESMFDRKIVDKLTEPVEMDVEGDVNVMKQEGDKWKQWVYTIHDANMGLECQRNQKSKIKTAMKKFSDKNEWDKVYKRAYKKMVRLGARWAIGNGYPITGHECRIYRSITGNICNKCNLNYFQFQYQKYICPSDCRCMTAFGDNERFYN